MWSEAEDSGLYRRFTPVEEEEEGEGVNLELELVVDRREEVGRGMEVVGEVGTLNRGICFGVVDVGVVEEAGD